jgi:hypothetical protein
LSKVAEEDEPSGNPWVKNSLSILAVVAAGTAGWAIAWQSGVWTPTPENSDGMDASKHAPFGAEILGYFSAVCYLGLVSRVFQFPLSYLHEYRARIPQIAKNYKDKSCEGKEHSQSATDPT